MGGHFAIVGCSGSSRTFVNLILDSFQLLVPHVMEGGTGSDGTTSGKDSGSATPIAPPPALSMVLVLLATFVYVLS